MILELVGLPGAGKTVCESFLQRGLAERGYRVLLPPELQQCYVRDRIYGKYKLNYALRRFLLTRALAYFLYRLRVNRRDLQNRVAVRGAPGPVRKAKRLPCQWLAEDMLLVSYYRETFGSSSEEKNVYLSSEGLTHLAAAVNVWAGVRYSSMSKRWLAQRTCEDMVVLHVRASVGTAFQRLWQRGPPRSWPDRAKATKSSARSVLERFAEAIEHSIEQYQSAGARVFTVDNSGDTLTLTRKVTEFVESLTREGRTVSEVDQKIQISQSEIRSKC